MEEETNKLTEEVANVTQQANETIDRAKEIEAVERGKADIKILIEAQKKLLADTEERKKEIKDIEASVDKKTSELKRVLFENQVQGKGFAGQVPKVETEQEKWAREAKIRYAGTGLDPT